MKFFVCESLTNRIVGELYPSRWELTDPLRAPGTGTLTVPLPTDPDAVARLVDLTLQRRRWVAVEYIPGQMIFGGPIPRRPARSGGEVIIPLVDWRAWFYKANLRPIGGAAGARNDYIRTNREQGLIMTDLMTAALDTPGKPLITVDTAPTTGVTRDITALQLDRSIGEHLDSITNRDRGAEWFTYVQSAADQNQMIPHVAVAFPARHLRDSAVRVEYRVGTGGNAMDYAWPEGSDANTRVWAIGDGEPPDQALASDEYPELDAGLDVAWEDVLGPLDGVVKNATAFEYAYSAIQRSRGFEGTAEFTILDKKLPLGDVSTGDRARVILEDGWDSADVRAARIIERTMSGGRGQPTRQRLKIDLADDASSDDQDTPGEAVDDE